MTILIVGGGNMGLTFAQRFLRSKIVSAGDLHLLERSPDKAAELAALDIGTVHAETGEWLETIDIIILAVKPQDTPTMYQQLGHHLKASQVILSIMAGISLATISTALGISKVIRAMPNLPARVGSGMTVYTATDAVTRSELATVNNLLNTTGKTIYVDREGMVDAATAISGSGPAYVFYLIEALSKAAMQLGFDQSQADLLATQTFEGASALLLADTHSCSEWIERVSSRGGTTEAALIQMRTDRVAEGLQQGARAAYHRAIELGKLP